MEPLRNLRAFAVLSLDDLLTRTALPLFAAGGGRAPEDRGLKRMFVTMRRAKETPTLQRLRAFLRALRENGVCVVLFTTCDPRVACDLVTGWLRQRQIPFDLLLYGDEPAEFCEKVPSFLVTLCETSAGFPGALVRDTTGGAPAGKIFEKLEDAVPCLTKKPLCSSSTKPRTGPA